jgi:hypothetical protein
VAFVGISDHFAMRPAASFGLVRVLASEGIQEIVAKQLCLVPIAQALSPLPNLASQRLNVLRVEPARGLSQGTAPLNFLNISPNQGQGPTSASLFSELRLQVAVPIQGTEWGDVGL